MKLRIVFPILILAAGCAAPPNADVAAPVAKGGKEYHVSPQGNDANDGSRTGMLKTISGAALRAAEMRCDALLKGTSVDGVYDSDPKQNPDAKRFEVVSYDTVLAENLKVMDASAVALCRDNNIPIVVFSIRERGNLARVLVGEGTQTTVQQEA